MTALLEARDLALPGRLRATSLDIAAGELVCLIGPNGSGKTSLLHAIAGIGGPCGVARIAGQVPQQLAPAERIRLLSFLAATRELRWPLPARDLIALGGADAGEIEAAIAALELAPVSDRRVDQLSTGERSRVLIARALAARPRLLLLDEPTANLDPLWQIRLMEMLRRQLAGSGQAALVAIHDLAAAARYGDRLIMMAKGEIVAAGAPAEVLDGPQVRQVFGIERSDGEWRALSSPADLRSSP